MTATWMVRVANALAKWYHQNTRCNWCILNQVSCVEHPRCPMILARQVRP